MICSLDDACDCDEATSEWLAGDSGGGGGSVPPLWLFVCPFSMGNPVTMFPLDVLTNVCIETAFSSIVLAEIKQNKDNIIWVEMQAEIEHDVG